MREKALVINSLRGEKFKKTFSYIMSKATYVLAEKDSIENPDKESMRRFLNQKDSQGLYYRHLAGELQNQGYCVNKKKEYNNIMQKLGLQVILIRKAIIHSSLQR